MTEYEKEAIIAFMEADETSLSLPDQMKLEYFLDNFDRITLEQLESL